MNVYHTLIELPPFQNTVITIGSFDGVHAAHEIILNKIQQIAADNDLESVVITFHPHPRMVVNHGDRGLKLLSTKSEKILLLEKYHLNSLVFAPFSAEFASLTAEDYVMNFLVKYFHPKYIVIGYDHQFGKDRRGNIELLKQLAPGLGYEVIEIEKQVIDNVSISSTKIRNALFDSDLQRATKLLGHPYRLTGVVVRGKQLGSSLGFPTANIETEEIEKLVPAAGIYAVWVYVGNQKHGGMLYIGDRPTLEDSGAQSIEVNIFSFDRDIYGQRISVEFVGFIRHDEKFNNLEDLRQALAIDQIQALKQLKISE